MVTLRWSGSRSSSRCPSSSGRESPSTFFQFKAADRQHAHEPPASAPEERRGEDDGSTTVVWMTCGSDQAGLAWLTNCAANAARFSSHSGLKTICALRRWNSLRTASSIR